MENSLLMENKLKCTVNLVPSFSKFPVLASGKIFFFSFILEQK